MAIMVVTVCVLLVFAVVATGAHATALGFKTFTEGAFNADGTAATQAGGHPWELTTSFSFDTVFDPDVNLDVPKAQIKNVALALPPGLVGDPHAMNRCTQFEIEIPRLANCPVDTQVGWVNLDVQFSFGRQDYVSPVYNMVPPPGEPAQLAFVAVAAIGHIDFSARSGSDYGLTATVRNTNTTTPVYGATFHIWGVPADATHDAFRFAPTGTGAFSPTPISIPTRAKPFLRNPTSCTGPLTSAIQATSWEEPETVVNVSAEAAAVTGCASVSFEPSLHVTPDTAQAGRAAGLGIDLDLPQNENVSGPATADLRRAVVTLPAGVAVNPSTADGLEACSDAQFAQHSTAAGACPDASKIGTMKITTPLLDNPLEGSVFIGTPLEQGPAAAAAGKMFRLFLEARGSGVEVKLAGSVVPDPVTGQLTATFDNNPQVPFTNVHLQLTDGPRAQLSLPKACGTYTTHSEFTSWATSTPVSDDDSFTIDQNCDQAGRFEPALDAGLTKPVAGAYSPFTMTLSRPDGQQDLSSLSLSLPPGLSGNIGSVPLCPDAQAATGNCSSASQIGRTMVAAGAGTNPLWVPQAGKTPTAVFLAGPYRGAPFSLVVVVPAQAGPFDLGTVVVRAALFIDKHDAHVSVVSDPIPTIIDGIVLNVQKLNVTVDRPGFTLAPTSCAATQITGTAGSSAGATAGLTSRFQVGGCGSLKFTPKFAFSTTGKTSKRLGASLTAKITYPKGSLGTQANITKVKVALPLQLPSQLATLQKACLASVFEANPASCPAHSVVGKAVVHTPLLPVPLTGPAYFVSHGGEAFPSLTMVLQGDGVTIELVGSTLIRKGITTTTFKTTPDVPFSGFELSLPQGEYSALGVNLPAKAHGSLCGQKLKMPTEAIAQNGRELHQDTPIAITGCKGKATKSAKTKRRRGHASSRRR